MLPDQSARPRVALALELGLGGNMANEQPTVRAVPFSEKCRGAVGGTSLVMNRLLVNRPALRTSTSEQNCTTTKHEPASPVCTFSVYGSLFLTSDQSLGASLSLSL